jgi:hypothetical protein
MRRLVRLCAIGGVAAALILTSGGAALAQPGEACTVFGDPPGQLVSFVAQTFGHSGTHNPGNAHNPFPPFIPFVAGCNPNA